MMKKTILLLLSTMLICWAAAPIEVSFAEVKRIYNAGSGLFIDAREQKFYKKGTILGALNMPIKRFSRLKRLLPVRKNSKLVIFCGGIKCGKSVKLAKRIASEGYSHVLIYRGGYPEWHQKAQEIMLLATYCQSNTLPKPKPVTIQGATVQLGSEEGMIDATWFVQQLNAGTLPPQIQLVDLRSKEDYDQQHLTNAIHLDLDTQTGELDSTKLPKDKLSLFYCYTGMRSTDAYDTLDKQTAKRVRYLNAVVKCKKEKCEIHPN
jgi:rhodanese-related sulfurtransferase